MRRIAVTRGKKLVALGMAVRRRGGEFRRGAAEILRHIHTNLTVQKLSESFPCEKDEDTKRQRLRSHVFDQPE